jgi:hypothetical protein
MQWVDECPIAKPFQFLYNLEDCFAVQTSLHLRHAVRRLRSLAQTGFKPGTRFAPNCIMVGSGLSWPSVTIGLGRAGQWQCHCTGGFLPTNASRDCRTDTSRQSCRSPGRSRLYGRKAHAASSKVELAFSDSGQGFRLRLSGDTPPTNRAGVDALAWSGTFLQPHLVD